MMQTVIQFVLSLTFRTHMGVYGLMFPLCLLSVQCQKQQKKSLIPCGIDDSLNIKPWKSLSVKTINRIWNAESNHYYITRTNPSKISQDAANAYIYDNQIQLMSYWENFQLTTSMPVWNEDPYKDTSWKLYYHSLRTVSFLVNAYESGPQPYYLKKAQAFIETWIKKNPGPNKSVDPMAWNDHSTANRVMTLIYFWDNYRSWEYFDRDFAALWLASLEKHAQFLACNDYYNPRNNHGLFQLIALLEIAFLFPVFSEHEKWIELTNTRLNRYLTEQLTAEAVLKEHSPAYHLLVYKLLMKLNQLYNRYGQIPELLIITLERMPTYLQAIIKPDGTLPQVGDSGQVNVKPLIKDLPPLTDKYLIFPEAGNAIFRDRLDDPQLYFTFFSRYHSYTHKHADDLSILLSYQGVDYFVDSGKYNFKRDDPFRDYFRSTVAHNTLTVDDKTYNYQSNNLAGKAGFEHFETGTDYVYIKGFHNLYEQVHINREIIFIDSGIIYIKDTLKAKADQRHTYTQIFNLGKTIQLDVKTPEHIILSESSQNTRVHLRQLHPVNDFKVYQGNREPIRGWQSIKLNQKYPIQQIEFRKNGTDTVFETLIETDSPRIERVDSNQITQFIFSFNDGSRRVINLKGSA